MTLRQIILLLKAEKHRRMVEIESKHRPSERTNRLINEEVILDNALRAINETGFEQPSKWVNS